MQVGTYDTHNASTCTYAICMVAKSPLALEFPKVGLRVNDDAARHRLEIIAKGMGVGKESRKTCRKCALWVLVVVRVVIVWKGVEGLKGWRRRGWAKALG